MPTDVVTRRRCPTSAAIAASSHSATTRGVASTGTSPDAHATAVSASPTTSSDLAAQAGFQRAPSVRYGVARAAFQPSDPHVDTVTTPTKGFV